MMDGETGDVRLSWLVDERRLQYLRHTMKARQLCANEKLGYNLFRRGDDDDDDPVA